MSRVAHRWAGLVALLGAALLAGCRGAPPAEALARGLRALQEGDNPQALRLLRRAAHAEPANATAQANLGLALLRAGRYEAGEEALRRAAALVPQDPRPLEFVAHGLAARGQWAAAAGTLEEALQRSPRSPRILTALGCAQLNAAGPEAARAAFLQALAISPNYGPALFNLGVLHRDHLGDAAEARRCFQLYLAGLTDEPYASQARQALASPPAPPPSTPTPKPAGTALPTPKPPATASSAATPPARATAPFDPVVSAALNTARAAIQKGILDDALVTLQRAAVQRPDNPDLAWEIARLYHRHLNDPQHTALLYDEFVQRFPADPRAAEARAERAKLPPSVDSLPTPTRRTADRRKATEAYNAGVAAHQGGKLTKAIELYRQALESDPGMTDAYYNLGLAYQASSDLVRAKAAFRQALEYEPAMLNARYMLGLVYRDLNEDRDAIAALEAVLKANPNHADAHLALAYVYRKAPSQSALARQHFERYLALEPNGESAASVRQWLQSGR